MARFRKWKVFNILWHNYNFYSRWRRGRYSDTTFITSHQPASKSRDTCVNDVLALVHCQSFLNKLLSFIQALTWRYYFSEPFTPLVLHCITPVKVSLIYCCHSFIATPCYRARGDRAQQDSPRIQSTLVLLYSECKLKCVFFIPMPVKCQSLPKRALCQKCQQYTLYGLFVLPPINRHKIIMKDTF